MKRSRYPPTRPDHTTPATLSRAHVGHWEFIFIWRLGDTLQPNEGNRDSSDPVGRGASCAAELQCLDRVSSLRATGHSGGLSSSGSGLLERVAWVSVFSLSPVPLWPQASLGRARSFSLSSSPPGTWTCSPTSSPSTTQS